MIQVGKAVPLVEVEVACVYKKSDINEAMEDDWFRHLL